MRGLLSLVALVLLLIWVPSGDLVSLDTPFPQEGNYGTNGGGGPDDGGDDHPFGGESSGGGTDVRVTIQVAFGIPSFDILYYLPGVNSLAQWFFLIEPAPAPQVERREESVTVRNHERATGSERVQR